MFTFGFFQKTTGIFLHEFECQVVCLCVIYVFLCVLMYAVLWLSHLALV